MPTTKTTKVIKNLQNQVKLFYHFGFFRNTNLSLDKKVIELNFYTSINWMRRQNTSNLYGFPAEGQHVQVPEFSTSFSISSKKSIQCNANQVCLSTPSKSHIKFNLHQTDILTCKTPYSPPECQERFLKFSPSENSCF